MLLLDEPPDGIQPNIIQQIRLLRSKGDMAIVQVERYFDFAYDLADSSCVFERGRVTTQGRKDQLTCGQLRAGLSI